jgi:hydroxyacylglutathione hydrolase
MRVLSIQVGEIQTNCYLLCDEQAKVCFVIDPGDEAGRVEEMIASSGCALQAILLTHGHFDHYSGVAGLLQRHPEVPVYIHKNDCVDVPQGEYGLKMTRLDDKHQRFYKEGDVLTLGSISLRVMETPGHSTGSVCLVTDGVIFSGDTLFRFSCGRTDLADGNYLQMLNSLSRLAALPGEYHVYPGHEAQTDLGAERAGNPYMQPGIRP